MITEKTGNVLFLLVTTTLKARNVCICCWSVRKSKATCKQTQLLPTSLAQQCWELLCPCWGKWMQQLPTMLGPAVHRGKDTTQKTLETMCNAGAWPQQCCKSCANESNIVALRFGDHGTKEILEVVGSKVWPVSTTPNITRQHATGTRHVTFNNVGGCWLTMLRPLAQGLKGPYFTLIAQNIYRIISKLEADGVRISLPPPTFSLHEGSLLWAF